MALATDADAPMVFIASIQAGNALAGVDVEASCRNIVRGLGRLPQLATRKEFADIVKAIPVAQMAWIAGLRMSKPEHLAT